MTRTPKFNSPVPAAGSEQMSATILAFPRRSPFAIRVVATQGAWTVVAGDHSWEHGSRREALIDADAVARTFGVGIVVEPEQ